MEDRTTKCLEIGDDSGVGAARRATRSLAHAAGFDPTSAEEIVLAASELATNLLKHARGGTLTLTLVSADAQTGIILDARDQGPGITDVNQALADGFSTAGGLGLGLGAVNRLMDECEISSIPKSGTRVLCRKWLRKPPAYAGKCPLDAGAASRPRYMEDHNGDAFVIKPWAACLLVGVIDGLGHGPLAQKAALAARDYVERHFDLPMSQIFLGVDRACRGTRGCVMALARIDWERESIVCASVGNIEHRVFPPSRTNHFEVRRGIIGLNAPKPIVKESPWPNGNLLALYSDGIRHHWTWDDFPGLPVNPASEVAQTLLRRLGKDDDDATIVVVRSTQT
jgi:anti-sigma regulatory factor (Ser/Thr protein kinase)